MKLHPYTTIFPEMPETDFQALVDDIRKHGIIEPVKLHDGQIIDGRHRFKAAQILGIECPSTEIGLEPGETILDLVVSLNLVRRHLTPSQLAAVGAEIAAKAASQTTGAPIGARTRPEGKTTVKAAEAVGVSARSVERAKTVLEKAPQVFEEIKTGERSVRDAYEEVKASAPVSGIKDANGKEIEDEDMARIFAERRFRELDRGIVSIMDAADLLSKEPAGAFIDMALIRQGLKNARKALASGAKPYALCPMHPNCETNCKLCRGAGFVPESVWKTIPEELKS